MNAFRAELRRFIDQQVGGIDKLKHLIRCAINNPSKYSQKSREEICLGLLAGFIASHMVNHRGEGMVLDILLGRFVRVPG